MGKGQHIQSRGVGRLAFLLFAASSLALSLSGCGELAQRFSQALRAPAAVTPSVPPVCVQPSSAVPSQVTVPAQGSYPASSIFEIEGSFPGVSIDSSNGLVTVVPVGYGIPNSLIEIPVKVTSPGNQVARYDARIFFKSCPDQCAADEIFNSISGECEKCAVGQVPNQDKTACVSCSNGADNPLACDHCPSGLIMIGGQCVGKNDCTATQVGKGYTYDPAANACICALPKFEFGGSCVVKNDCTASQLSNGYSYDPSTNSCSCASPKIDFGGACVAKNDCTADQSNKGFTYDGSQNQCLCASPKEVINGLCVTKNNCTSAQLSNGFTYDPSSNSCTCASPNIIVGDRCEPKNDCTASQLSNGYTYDASTNSCSCASPKIEFGGACVAKNDCTASQLSNGYTYDPSTNSCSCASPKIEFGGACVAKNDCSAAQLSDGFTYDPATNTCSCASPKITFAGRCVSKGDCTATQLSNGYTYDSSTNSCVCAPPKVEDSGTCNRTAAGSFDYESSYKACFSSGLSSFQIPIQDNSLKGADRFLIASVKRDSAIVSPTPSSITVSAATGTLTIGSPLAKGIYEVEVHAYQNGQYNPADPNSYVVATAMFEIVDCADLFYAEYNSSCSANLTTAKVITPLASSYKKPSGWTLQVLSPTSPAFSVDSSGKITIPAGTPAGVYPVVIRATDPVHSGVYVDRTVTVDVRDCTANTVTYTSPGADQCSSSAFSLTPSFASGSNTWGVFEIRAMIRDGVSLAKNSFPAGITIDSNGVISVAAGVPAGSYTITIRASDANDPSIYVETTAKFKVIDCLSGSWSLKYQSVPSLCFSGSFSEYSIQLDSSAQLSGVDTFELVAPVDTGFTIDSSTGVIKVSKSASVAIHQIKVRAYKAASYIPTQSQTYVETTVKVTVTSCSTLFNISFPEVCANPDADFLLEYEPGYVKPIGWVLSVVEPVPFIMDSDGSINATMKTCKDSNGNLISQDCILVKKSAGPGVHQFTVRAKDPNSSVYIDKSVTLTLDDCTPAPAALIVLDSKTLKDHFDFGDVKVGSSSDWEEFTVINVGDSDGTLEDPIYATATAQNGSGSFDFDENYAPPSGVVKCSKGTVLAAAGGQCRMRVRYTATQKGPEQADFFGYAQDGVISSPAKLTANSIMGVLVRENQFNPVDFANENGEDILVDAHTTGINKKPGGAQLDHYNVGGKPFPGKTTTGPTARTGYHPEIGYMDEVFTGKKRTGYATDLARSVSSVRGSQSHDFDVVPDDTTCGFFRVGHFTGANVPNAPMVWGVNLPPINDLPYTTELATNYTVTGVPLLPSGSVYLRAEDNDPIYRDDLLVPDVNGNVIPRWIGAVNAQPAANFLQLYNQTYGKPNPGIVGFDIKNFVNVGAATQLRDLYHTFYLNEKYQGTVRDKNGNVIPIDVDYRNICGVYMQVSASPNPLAFGAAQTATPVSTNFLQFFSTLAQDSSIDRRVWATRFDDLFKPHPNSPGMTFTQWLGGPNTSRHLFLLELQNLVSGNWGLDSIMNHFGEQLNVRFSVPSMEINSVALLVFYQKDKVRSAMDEWTPPVPPVPPRCQNGDWGDFDSNGTFWANPAYTDELKQQYPDVNYFVCGGAANSCQNSQATCSINWKCNASDTYEAFKKRVANDYNKCMQDAQNPSASGGAHVLDQSQCCQDCSPLKKSQNCWGACSGATPDGKGGISGSSTNTPIPYDALKAGDRCNANGTQKSYDDIQALIDQATTTAKKQCTSQTPQGYVDEPSCSCSPYTSSWLKRYFDQDDCLAQKGSKPSYTHSHSDTYWCEGPTGTNSKTGSYTFKYKKQDNLTTDKWDPNDPAKDGKTIGKDVFEEHPCPTCQNPRTRTENYWERACPKVPHSCKQYCRDYRDDNSDPALRSGVQWGSGDPASSNWQGAGTWEVDGAAGQKSCPKTNGLSYEPKCCDPDGGFSSSDKNSTPPPDFLKSGPSVKKYDENGCPVDCTTKTGCTDDKKFFRYIKVSSPQPDSCMQDGKPYVGDITKLFESGDAFQCCMTGATGDPIGTVPTKGSGSPSTTSPGWDLGDPSLPPEVIKGAENCCNDPLSRGSKLWKATCCQMPQFAGDPSCKDGGGGDGSKEDTTGGWFDPNDPNGGKHFGP